MDVVLTTEQLFWLDYLMTRRVGEPVVGIPDEVLAFLFEQKLAHRYRGEIEITFEGIREVLRLR